MDAKDVEDVALLVTPRVNNKEKVWKLFEIAKIQCQFLQLYNHEGQDDHMEPQEVCHFFVQAVFFFLWAIMPTSKILSPKIITSNAFFCFLGILFPWLTKFTL